VCKISPYVGIVYPRYAFNSTESLPAIVGCEAVLYAWGWPAPQQVSSGQDYEAWFRNGELRFSMWISLSDQVGSSLPAADDHQWWNSRCEQAWSSTTNILYSGVYKIGPTVYTDSIRWPIQVEATIPITGGSLTSAIDGVVYTFPANSFTEPVTVTHTIRFQGEAPPLGDLRGVNRFYEVAAVTRDTGQPVQPTGPYTVTIQYTSSATGPVMDDTLAAYSWNADQWVKEPSSVVQTELHTVVARPSHFSQWAVLGETRRVFLPAVSKNVR
jgi:hypothetical protein